MSSSLPILTLRDVSLALPDGRRLFDGVDLVCERRLRLGLIGPNGCGKTALCRIAAGLLRPSGGVVERIGKVACLPQLIDPAAFGTVAALMGLAEAFQALARLEAGTGSEADAEILADRWTLREDVHRRLADHGLDHLTPDRPAGTLSGGEATRAAMIGLGLQMPDLMILDEPTNTLDAESRVRLLNDINAATVGLLVVSHDRAVLDAMDVTLELSANGVRRYGGNYQHYRQIRQAETGAAQARLDHLDLERKRLKREEEKKRDRQARRTAAGRRRGKTANDSKISLDRAADRADRSAGKGGLLILKARNDLEQALTTARNAADTGRPDARFDDAAVVVPIGKTIIRLENAELPFGPAGSRFISLQVVGAERVAIVGPNGCGKSTLLRLIGGAIAPVSGSCVVGVPFGMIDQHIRFLDPALSPVEVFRERSRLSGTDIRTRLAGFGLGPAQATRPSGGLSGGERVRAALACLIGREEPVPLLLLDEITNHLDLTALESLEAMIAAYRGAIVVVSHDHVFLDRIGITRHIVWEPTGWRVE